MRKWEYIQRDKKALRSWFNGKKGRISWEINSFFNWYNEQEKVCRYCGISESNCQEVVHTGLLNSKRFATEGVFARGINRGYWLEIDRKEPNEPYSKENCVLACYFCNNDKSDVFNETQYLEFKENRADFLRKLIKK